MVRVVDQIRTVACSSFLAFGPISSSFSLFPLDAVASNDSWLLFAPSPSGQSGYHVPSIVMTVDVGSVSCWLTFGFMT